MAKFDLSTATLGEVLDDPQAAAIIEGHVPGLTSNPMVGMARGLSVEQALSMAGGFVSADQIAAIKRDVEAL